MADDLPVGLLELAARVDDGLSIDWDAEERAATDDSERAVIQGFRLLAGVAAVAQDVDGAASAAPRPLVPSLWPAVDVSGASWGPLRLEEAVGRGAFSQVYRARDPLGRDVAVKLLSPRLGDDDPSSRVLEEGRVLASVKHPNIVVVHGADDHDGRVGLWMEFVRGRTLAAEVDARGAHSAEEAIVVGRALCGALAAVHARGLIHGDVKAHNVMREEGGRVVLMDFGAGRSMQPSSPAIDSVAGTPLYLCPERLRGGAPTAATDIYSLGVLLYHLVTQDYPVEGATRADVEAAHRAGRRTRLRDRRPDLPDAFVSAVERAIAPEPSARFATAGAFEEALAAAGASAGRSDVAPRTIAGTDTPARRRSLRLAIGLAAVAVLAIATTAGLWRWAGVGALPTLPLPPPMDFGAGAPRFEVSAEFQQVLDQGRRRLDAGARIEPTMALAFELEASRDVYVYIVNEDDHGRSYALFPVANTLQNPLAGGITHVLPGGPPWEVDSTGGQEHLFVIVSPTPVPEIADAVAALPPATGEPRSDGNFAANTRGIGGRRRASAADAARPWRQHAQPLLPGRHRSEGLWVREFILKNP